jgi:hypothetical protein
VVPKRVPTPRIFRPSGDDGSLRVRFNHVDVGGPWCLSRIESEHFVDLLGRLNSFETMTCAEVFFAPGRDEGKTYQVDDLPNPNAQNRLVDLEWDDQTEIARLQINGKRRLYGFLPDGGPDFYVLWWDPEHEIWPSTLRHT